MHRDGYIIAATRKGVLRLEDRTGQWVVTHRFAEGDDIRSVAAQGETAIAGGQAGIFRSEDEGRHWTEAGAGLTIPYIRWVEFHPGGSGRAFAGTEPAAIFLSVNGGVTWNERPEEMIERFVPVGCTLIAVCSDGRLFRSHGDTARWEPFLPEISNARMAVFAG